MPLNPSYPTSLDSLQNPTALTKRNDSGFELDQIITRIHQILQFLEGKLGITNSAPANKQVLQGNGVNSSAWASSLDLSGDATVAGGINANTTGAAAGEVKTAAAIRVGTAIYPSGQAVLFASAPVAAVSVVATGIALIGASPRAGFVRVYDQTVNLGAVFTVNGAANTTSLHSGDATKFGVSLANDNKIHCVFNGGNYLLYNGYGVSHVLYAWFEGF